jgi:ribosomal protein L11
MLRQYEANAAAVGKAVRIGVQVPVVVEQFQEVTEGITAAPIDMNVEVMMVTTRVTVTVTPTLREEAKRRRGEEAKRRRRGWKSDT